MSDEIRIGYEALIETIKNALAAAGMPEHVREVEAEVTAEADLMGVPSHGVRTLPLLLKALRDGRANPDPQIKTLREQAATCLIDGDRGPGRYVSVQAMQLAVERARTYGVGLCVARAVTHWGRAHAYAYRAAQAGMIGFCTTNAIPNMAAFGSTKHVLGNNPLAIGVPRGADQDPVVLDMAMSQAAVGKIGTYLREGKPVPEGWGLDAQGRPTNDPAAILASGLVLPMAEHKGSGLALMMEIFTGVLSGGLLSQEAIKRDASGLDPDGSKFMLAIDPAMFTEPEQFGRRVDDLLDLVSAEFRPDQEFLYPGERGWRTRERYLAEGIPIHRQIVEQLAASGVRLAVA